MVTLVEWNFGYWNFVILIFMGFNLCYFFKEVGVYFFCGCIRFIVNVVVIVFLDYWYWKVGVV